VKAHRYFSNLYGKGTTSDDRNAPLVFNNKEATAVAEKANSFCRHFTKISTPARKKKKRVLSSATSNLKTPTTAHSAPKISWGGSPHLAEVTAAQKSNPCHGCRLFPLELKKKPEQE
jgi:hypothetical protein